MFYHQTMNMNMTYLSIGKRVEKSCQNPYGWKTADYIPENEVCVLILGGNDTDTNKKANGYAKTVSSLLEKHNLSKAVTVYSIIYHNDVPEEHYPFPFLIQKRNREALFKKYKHQKSKPMSNLELNLEKKIQSLQGKGALDESRPEISDPKYIEDLFDKTLLYRISQNGQRLPFPEAVSRVRKLNIVTHCHGAYIFLKLEELMQKKLKELQYSEKEISAIQKQLFCIAHAPFAPLGVSKSTMISFGSALDNNIWHHNNFHQEIKNLNKEGALRLCYFPQKQGELFLTPAMTADKEDSLEHNFVDYVSPKEDLSEDGKILVTFSANALIGAVKSSLCGQKLPDIKTLVCAHDTENEKHFESALKNGSLTYEDIKQNAKLNALKKRSLERF